jgi:hypothetical protein
LEKGTLGIPDLPLTFALQAGLAKALQLASGASLDRCIVLAVKLADAILPPLAAVPVFFLGRTWARQRARGMWLPLVAAAAVSFGALSLSMTGDFQKNCLALVWLAGLIWALRIWMTHHRRKPAIAALVLLGLSGLTHIGVFGSALLLTALVLAAHLLVTGGLRNATVWKWLIAALLVTSIVSACVLWRFDAARIQRLLSVLTHPVQFLGGLRMMGPPGGPSAIWLKLLQSLPTVLFGSIAVYAWRRRADLQPADTAIVIGTALAVSLLTGPWVGGDVLMRFSLIAMVPGVVATLFALMSIRRRWLRGLLGGLSMVLILVPSLAMLAHGGHFVLSTEAYRELESLKDQVSDPQRTLVVAAHGIEWWTAWTLHTQIAHASALRPEDWHAYDSVLFLSSKQGFPGSPGGPRRPPPWTIGPHHPPAGNPPPLGMPGLMPPPGMPGPMAGPPGMNPMAPVPIPPGATILHEGRYFTLARVDAPPEFVKARSQRDQGIVNAQPSP